MGHEFTSEMVELGPDVQKFKKGDNIVTPFTINCGQCFLLRAGVLVAMREELTIWHCRARRCAGRVLSHPARGHYCRQRTNQRRRAEPRADGRYHP
jgi:hypothetical protein